jgi:hypothetical protein
MVGKGEEYSPKNLFKDAGKQFDELKKYNTWKEFTEAFADETNKAMRVVESDWHAVFGFGFIGICSALYLIWNPVDIILLNNFLLAISLMCMGLQIVAFYLLAHHRAKALKL